MTKSKGERETWNDLRDPDTNPNTNIKRHT